MSNPLEQLLMGMFPQLQSSDGSTSLSFVNVPGGGTAIRLGSGGSGTGREGATASLAMRSSGSASTLSPTSRGTGIVYGGEMPPMVWIQREQQRMPRGIPGAGAAVREGVSMNAAGSTPSGDGNRSIPGAASTHMREAGNRAFAAGHYEEAISFYTEALREDPTSELALTNRSFAYYRLDQYSQSASDAQAAIHIRPDFFKPYYRLGLAQFAMGNYLSSLESLRKGLSFATGENVEMFLRAIAKCESKLARVPVTPLIMASPTTGFRDADVKPDYARVAELAGKVATSRSLVASYTTQYQSQRDIVECEARSKRIKQFLTVATSNALPEATKEANDKQDALRRTLKGQDRTAYFAAKKERDSAYQHVWDTAARVEEALRELKKIAADEQAFFKRFGSPPLTEEGEIKGEKIAVTSEQAARQGTNGMERTDGVEADHTHTSSSLSSSPSFTGGRDGQRSELTRLLRRRDEICSQVHGMQCTFAATDAAAKAFLEALRDEQSACAKLTEIVAEADTLNTQLEEHARHVGHTTTQELSDSRLEALDQVRSAVQRAKSDETSFRATLEEGDRLLEREAALEGERLIYERQRIQLQAEIEWCKVRDEPERKVLSLQNHVKVLQQRISDSNLQQKDVQQRILHLIQTDHPELAWKSMSSGSRILRLVKGSGLWLNLSFTDFQIIGTLSSTVNSKVYHATRRGEHVAIKEIPVDDEQARRRIQREVSIVASCSHPNIIRIKGVFFDGPFAYILLPYYRGSVRAWLTRKEPMSWVAMQDVFRQLATGMAYLHERGIVHADIKPSNILLADDGRPIIADFGIAKNLVKFGDKPLDYTVTTTNTTGAAVGTATYMAPEQLIAGEGRSGPTCKSDMWALGLTLYEMAAYNAFFHDPSLGKPVMPVVQAGDTCVQVSAARVGGNECLADMISSVLMVDFARRPSEYGLLAHPYFSSTNAVRSASSGGLSAGVVAAGGAGGSGADGSSCASALARSDERLAAVRSYIHAVRTANDRRVLVSVDRTRMVDSVHAIFGHLDNTEMLQPIMVVFQGEAGIDEGALTTEMLSLYYEQLVREKKALVCSDEFDVEQQQQQQTGGEETSATTVSDEIAAVFASGATYLPAEDEKSAFLPTDTFENVGKALLKSVIENRPLPLQLNSAVLKYFCGAPVSIVDLEEYDHSLAETLKRMRILSSEDLAAADLDFSCFPAEYLASHCDGNYGQDTAVSTENVRDYIQLRAHYDLVEKQKKALEAIKKGFYNIDTLNNHLKLLSSSDLLLLLCGVRHISAATIVDALEFQGFDAASNTPEYLKELLTTMSQNNLRRFLQLCTSTATLRANDTMKKIKVLRCADSQRLPVGHGCVFQLDLPDYNDKQVLRDKLEMALAHVSDGFHIV